MYVSLLKNGFKFSLAVVYAEPVVWVEQGVEVSCVVDVSEKLDSAFSRSKRVGNESNKICAKSTSSCLVRLNHCCAGTTKLQCAECFIYYNRVCA